MKTFLAVCLAVASVSACERRAAADADSGSRHSADTVVTKRELQDTSIIRHDTTISTDTVKKRGARPVKTDTIRKP